MKNCLLLAILYVTMLFSCKKNEGEDIPAGAIEVQLNDQSWQSAWVTDTLIFLATDQAYPDGEGGYGIISSVKALVLTLKGTDSSGIEIMLQNLSPSNDNSLQTGSYLFQSYERLRARIIYVDAVHNIRYELDSGLVLISENDVTNKTISGSIAVSKVMYHTNKKNLKIKFDRLKYVVKKTQSFSPEVSMEINGQTVTTHVLYGNSIIEPSDKWVQFSAKFDTPYYLTLRMRDNSAGTALDQNAFYPNSVFLINPDNQEYVADSSTATCSITDINLTNRTVSGTFSGTLQRAGTSDQISITNGHFTNISWDFFIE